MVSKKTDRIIKIVLVIAAIITVIGISYALLTATATGEKSYALTGNNLKVYLDESKNLSDIMGENTVPVADYVGESSTPYTFSIVNDETTPLSYNIYLVEDDNSDMPIEGIRYNLIKKNFDLNKTDNVNTTSEAIGYLLNNDTINSNTTHEYELRLWMGEEVSNEAKGKTFSAHIEIEAVQLISDLYVENILNGADPVLTDNLVPVKISNTGVVTKADIHYEWYNYSNKEWANAVVLKDQTETYNVNQEIPEENIESYFVWIPKYSYQLWDLGNYTSLTSNGNKQQEIKIKFGTTNTNNTNANECLTPEVAGETGKCIVGDYMTHPAFLAFEGATGFWTGKFETGFSETTAPTSTTGLSTDATKVIIKPNVYSWRNNTLGNMFKLGYDYIREDESHMMKNTEWGAVAYLQHSAYGLQESLRINNNNKYITGYAATEEPTKGQNTNSASIDGNRVEGTSLGTDGTYTVNYLNTASTVASTTGNYSGIYDMSGGVWEHVMGYTTGSSLGVGGSSGITSLYSDFYTNSEWNKYYDKYSSTAKTNYTNRILGDATGEMGPFFSETDPDTNTRYKNSWYKDYAHFAYSTEPWFRRGGDWNNGTGSGAFAFITRTGAEAAYLGFRIVLTPTK